MYESVEDGVEDIVNHMSKSDCNELTAYISNLLASDLSNSEFKRIWNKSEAHIFVPERGNSGAFKSFFQLVLNALEGQKNK